MSEPLWHAANQARNPEIGFDAFGYWLLASAGKTDPTLVFPGVARSAQARNPEIEPLVKIFLTEQGAHAISIDSLSCLS